MLLIFVKPETSLAHIDAVNARLAETQNGLQKEIDSLQVELTRNQDPEKMQLIQEMISVSYDFFSITQWLIPRPGSVRADVAHPREGNRI